MATCVTPRTLTDLSTLAHFAAPYKRTVVQEIVTTYYTAALHLATEFNSTAVIAHLPDEVLTKVFLYVRELGCSRQHPFTAVQLVCRRWRNVALVLQEQRRVPMSPRNPCEQAVQAGVAARATETLQSAPFPSPRPYFEPSNGSTGSAAASRPQPPNTLPRSRRECRLRLWSGRSSREHVYRPRNYDIPLMPPCDQSDLSYASLTNPIPPTGPACQATLCTFSIPAKMPPILTTRPLSLYHLSSLQSFPSLSQLSYVHQPLTPLPIHSGDDVETAFLPPNSPATSAHMAGANFDVPESELKGLPRSCRPLPRRKFSASSRSSCYSPPPTSPKRSFVDLEDENEDDHTARTKRCRCTIHIEEDVFMSEATPPSPVLLRRIELQRESVLQERAYRQRRLAARLSRYFDKLKTMMTTDDVEMADLPEDWMSDTLPLASKRHIDHDHLPSPKRKRTCRARRRRNRRNRGPKSETFRSKRHASGLAWEESFLEELIADAESAQSSPAVDNPASQGCSSQPPGEIPPQEPLTTDDRRPEVRSDQGGSCEAPQKKKRPHREDTSWREEPWGSQRALAYYHLISGFFDTMKFSPDEPLAFDDVPWPTLLQPGTYGPHDLSWSAVESFFSICKSELCPGTEYKRLVQESHRRFHPDRWHARKVWNGVGDESLREELEDAVNVVAQALTPIWRAAKNLSDD